MDINQNTNSNKTFDIKNYSTEDLLGILDLTIDAPINENKINERLQILKYQLRNNKKKDKIFPFLEKAANKLKKAFEDFNNQTWQEAYEYDDSEATKVLTQQYQKKESDDNKNQILNWSSNIIGRPAQSQEDKIAIQETVQGDKNPLQRKTLRRTVNFDSHYREILDPSGTTCTNDAFALANPQVRLYTSTNYTVNLNQPLLNVVDINVDNVEIPYSWHVFAEDYGTNRFQFIITGPSGEIITDVYIPDGNYPSGATLINSINTALQSVSISSASITAGTFGIPFSYTTVPPNGLYFEYDSFSNRTIIHVAQKTTLNWYIEDSRGAQCASSFRESFNSLLEPPKPGNKINYNLGWLLGFRTQQLQLTYNQTYNNRRI